MADSSPVTDCRADRKRLAPFKASFKTDAEAGAECSDYDDEDPRAAEWPHNIISVKVRAWSCGIIAREGEVVTHRHDPEELERCRRLAREAARELEGVETFGGEPCEGGYMPFFVTAGIGDPAPKALTDEVLRKAFGGALYPDTPITLYPLEESGAFWDLITGVYRLEDDERRPRWKRCVQWFKAQQELRDACYVDMGYDDCQGPNLAAVFPRLVVALTRAGSLVGAAGCIVQA